MALLGHIATVQSDPEAALEMALSRDFDLILLDLGMPKMDGFEVLRLLRSREAESEQAPLPVVAVTGYASDADRLRCLAAGFNEHLTKPIQASTLSATIERILGRSAAPGSAESDAQRLRATVRRWSESRSGSRAFAPTVTEDFALRSAQFIETMRQIAREEKNEKRGELVRAARALASSAEFLGALHLAGMSRELEAKAAAGDWADLMAAVAAVDHEHQAVLTLLFEATPR